MIYHLQQMVQTDLDDLLNTSLQFFDVANGHHHFRPTDQLEHEINSCYKNKQISIKESRLYRYVIKINKKSN